MTGFQILQSLQNGYAALSCFTGHQILPIFIHVSCHFPAIVFIYQTLKSSAQFLDLLSNHSTDSHDAKHRTD